MPALLPSLRTGPRQSVSQGLTSSAAINTLPVFRPYTASPSHHRFPQADRPHRALESHLETRKAREVTPFSKEAARLREHFHIGLGRLVTTIDTPTLEPQPSKISVDKYEVLTSYNWIAAPKEGPRIYVPGGAPVWKGPSAPITVRKDRRANKHGDRRHPNWSFQPVFQALEITRPSFRFDGIDLIVSRGTLAALLDFCRGNTTSFRLTAYMIRNTLLLDYPIAGSIAGSNSKRSYRHSLMRVSAKYPSELQGSLSHWRVFRYSLGPLNCVVRCEIDATLPFEDNAPTQATALTRTSRNGNGNSKAVCAGNIMAPHSQALALETLEFEKRNLDWIAKREFKKLYPQLWFGCVGHLAFAVHKCGNFREISVHNKHDQIAAWGEEDLIQAALRKMTALIMAAKDITRSCPGNKAHLVFEPEMTASVRVYEHQDHKHSHPLWDHYVKTFWEEGASTVEKPS